MKPYKANGTSCLWPCAKKHGKLVEQSKALRNIETTLLDCKATIPDTSNDIHVLTSSPCQNSGNFTVNNTSCHRVITALQSAPWPVTLSYNL